MLGVCLWPGEAPGGCSGKGDLVLSFLPFSENLLMPWVGHRGKVTEDLKCHAKKLWLVNDER